jgi:hypothetical protein
MTPTERIYNELFDGFQWDDFFEHETLQEAGNYLKNYAIDIIRQTSMEGICRNWALGLIEEADFKSMARTLFENHERNK